MTTASGLSFAVVVAHPDDDAYGMSGMVALHAEDPGFRFILIHATDGGAGDIRDGFPATRETLGRIRQQEDEAAWRALGREPDRHEWLGFSDGEVDQVPFEDLVDAVAAVLEEEQPTVVGTFGPDGIFAHPDHIAIGAATDAAFARYASTSGTAFRRLLHGAVPNSVFERWNRQRVEMGLEPFDPTQVYHMRGIPDEEIGLVVDCRSVAPQHRRRAARAQEPAPRDERRPRRHRALAEGRQPGLGRGGMARAAGRDTGPDRPVRRPSLVHPIVTVVFRLNR